jgi:fumarylacetoacetate (FAA) hydrolase
MKLLSYLKEENEQLAVLIDDRIYDIELIHPDIPNTMNMFLNYWEDLYPIVQAGELAIIDRETHSNKSKPAAAVAMATPSGSMWRQPDATARFP